MKKDYYKNQNNVMKIIKKNRGSKQESNIENYLTKKKNIKIEYGRDRYKNLSKEDKHRLKGYEKIS